MLVKNYLSISAKIMKAAHFGKTLFSEKGRYSPIKIIYGTSFIFKMNYNIVNSQNKKMKLFVKHFFSKCKQFRRKLRTGSHLLKNSRKLHFLGTVIDTNCH